MDLLLMELPIVTVAKIVAKHLNCFKASNCVTL